MTFWAIIHAYHAKVCIVNYLSVILEYDYSQSTTYILMNAHRVAPYWMEYKLFWWYLYSDTLCKNMDKHNIVITNFIHIIFLLHNWVILLF